jgi:hypothetical protein
VDLFAKPAYTWEKGKKTLSYSGHLARLQGVEGYALVSSAAQGRDLFTKILQIFDYSPDRRDSSIRAMNRKRLLIRRPLPTFNSWASNGRQK